jgi:hypothetical protein
MMGAGAAGYLAVVRLALGAVWAVALPLLACGLGMGCCFGSVFAVAPNMSVFHQRNNRFRWASAPLSSVIRAAISNVEALWSKGVVGMIGYGADQTTHAQTDPFDGKGGT